MNRNASLERDLERWLNAEAAVSAPEGLHAAVIERARTMRQRRKWTSAFPARWLGRNRGITLFAAAALLLVGGAMAAGSGVLRLPSLVPPQPAPTETPAVVPPRAPSWTATGSLTTTRLRGSATLLLDGEVLVAGGIRSTTDQGVSHPIGTAELYDPRTGFWTATGSMVTARQGHTATLLRDGKVLVAGGLGNDGSLASAELYDPATGSWTATGAMGTRRLHPTATLLPNGKVILAGGDASDGWQEVVAAAELYDPAAGTWTATGSMNEPRGRHTATLLADGTVLVVGGGISDVSAATAELYDPATGVWTVTGSTGTQRGGHTATLLLNGLVLVTGGLEGSNGRSAQLYDPMSGTWTDTGSMDTPRVSHAATLLPNGDVLVVGGGDFNDPLTSAELYGPGTGSWTPTPVIVTKGLVQSATLLPDGTVLVITGLIEAVVPTSADLYDPGTGQ